MQDLTPLYLWTVSIVDSAGLLGITAYVESQVYARHEGLWNPLLCSNLEFQVCSMVNGLNNFFACLWRKTHEELEWIFLVLKDLVTFHEIKKVPKHLVLELM